MLDKIFTPAQIADLLQVAEKTVYRWLDSGKLRGVKLGRLWRIREEHLEDFLKKNTTE